MKENNELEKQDLAIDREMEVDCDVGQEITVYIETWFDVDKKFGLHINDEDGTWLNLYGKYNPFEDTLRIECEISRDNGSEYFDYEPTKAEAQLIKDMITEKIREEYGQTPQEFCNGEKVYVYENRGSLPIAKITENHNRLMAYCEKKGYQIDGSISLSVPMSHSVAEFQMMIDSCKEHGISKIMVNNLRDIGRTLADIVNTIGALCANGFGVEVAASGQIFAVKSEENLIEQEEEQSFTLGGLS